MMGQPGATPAAWNEALGGDWRCDVCRRWRPDEKISVAKHVHILPTGVEVTENVKFCNDNEACERTAKVRSFTDLAYQGLAQENDHLSARVRAAIYSRNWWIIAWVMTFGSAGIVIAGIA